MTNHLTGRSKIVVIVTAAMVVIAVGLGAARLMSYVGQRTQTDRRLTDIAEQNKINGDILIDCTTPTPAPTPDDPEPRIHECFERGIRGQSGAIVEIDCRSRRQQARIPAPPDPRRPCIEQTDASIYPGVSGTPSRG